MDFAEAGFIAKEVTWSMRSQRVYRYATIGLLGLALTLAGFAGTAGAQGSTATMTVQPPSSEQPIKAGGPDIEVNVLASGVHNLAAFQFSLQYDSSILKYKTVDGGPMLGSSGRQVNCLDPKVTDNGKQEMLQFNCVTLGPPVSMGGKAGPDGSGVLATVTFSPKGGGTSPLQLSDAILVAAEVDSTGMPVDIPTTAESASMDIAGKSGGFAWPIVFLAFGAVVVVGLVGGGGVFVAKRRRS